MARVLNDGTRAGAPRRRRRTPVGMSTPGPPDGYFDLTLDDIADRLNDGRLDIWQADEFEDWRPEGRRVGLDEMVEAATTPDGDESPGDDLTEQLLAEMEKPVQPAPDDTNTGDDAGDEQPAPDGVEEVESP